MELSDDAWFEILLRCDATTICQLRCANRRFHSLCADDALWIAKLGPEYSESTDQSLTPLETYRQLIMHRSQRRCNKPWRNLLKSYDSIEKLPYPETEVVNVVLIGPANSGKSSAILQMFSPGLYMDTDRDSYAPDSYYVIIAPFEGAKALSVKVIDSHPDNLSITLRRTWGETKQAFILMFDVTDKQSFDDLCNVSVRAMEVDTPVFLHNKIPVKHVTPLIVFGNKADKLQDDVFPPPAFMSPLGDLVSAHAKRRSAPRCHKLSEITAAASRYGAMYYEGSAYSPQQMNELLRLAVRMALTQDHAPSGKCSLM